MDFTHIFIYGKLCKLYYLPGLGNLHIHYRHFLITSAFKCGWFKKKINFVKQCKNANVGEKHYVMNGYQWSLAGLFRVRAGYGLCRPVVGYRCAALRLTSSSSASYCAYCCSIISLWRLSCSRVWLISWATSLSCPGRSRPITNLCKDKNSQLAG